MANNAEKEGKELEKQLEYFKSVAKKGDIQAITGSLYDNLSKALASYKDSLDQKARQLKEAKKAELQEKYVQPTDDIVNSYYVIIQAWGLLKNGEDALRSDNYTLAEKRYKEALELLPLEGSSNNEGILAHISPEVMKVINAKKDTLSKRFISSTFEQIFNDEKDKIKYSSARSFKSITQLQGGQFIDSRNQPYTSGFVTLGGKSTTESVGINFSKTAFQKVKFTVRLGQKWNSEVLPKSQVKINVRVGSNGKIVSYWLKRGGDPVTITCNVASKNKIYIIIPKEYSKISDIGFTDFEFIR